MQAEQRRALTPEQTLLLALLEDAITCATKQATGFKGECLKRNALRWIKGDEYYAGYIFSFRSVCEELELDPTYMRRRILGGEVMMGQRRKKNTMYSIGRRNARVAG